MPPTPNLSAPPDAGYCAAVEQQYARGAAVSRDDAIACKSLGSQLYSSLGVDSGEVVIRGGTHYDFSYSEDAAFPASLRGYDITTWYASAWFDKYVKGDRTADARLLTDRWRHDAAEAAVDPGGDGNAYSFYHLSRMDMRTVSGANVDCEDLRAGCPSLTSDDGVEGEYSYLALDTSLDRKHQTVAARTCTSHRTVVVHLQPRRGHRVSSVVARVGSRVIGRSRTRRVALRLIGLPRGQVTVWILERMRNTRTGKTSTLRTKRRYRTCGAKAWGRRQRLLPAPWATPSDARRGTRTSGTRGSLVPAKLSR